MYKLIFGILMGAGLAYWFFETSSGREKRQTIRDKLGMSRKRTDNVAQRTDAPQAGRETAAAARQAWEEERGQAQERAQSVANSSRYAG